MAQHKAAMKAVRQTTVLRARNRHYRTMARNALKSFRSAVDDGAELSVVESAFQHAEQVFRRVSGKGIIKAQTASRTISRMARRLNAARSK